MKRLFAMIICLLMAVTVFGGCNSDKYVPEEPQYDENGNLILNSPTAWELVDAMNLGINLGNTFDAYNADKCDTIEYEWPPIIGENKVSDYENYWGGGHSTVETFEGMKAAGFDTVRVPVFWGSMMENDGTWTINKDLIKRVKEVVDAATEADMHVIINIHHFDEFIIRRYPTDEACEIFKILWTQIAEYFRDCPYTVLFEGYNEYLGNKQFDENGVLQELSEEENYYNANSCNQAFVDAVRATGGNNLQRVLIASGYTTNIDRTTDEQFIMPTDTVPDRLMVSVHYIDNVCYWMKNIGSQYWIDYIDDQCDRLDKAFTSKGIPVFVGETTARYDFDRFDKNGLYKKSEDCMEYLLNEAYDRNYVCVLWTAGSDYFNRETCAMDEDYDVQKHAEAIARIAERLR